MRETEVQMTQTEEHAEESCVQDSLMDHFQVNVSRSYQNVRQAESARTENGRRG